MRIVSSFLLVLVCCFFCFVQPAHDALGAPAPNSGGASAQKSGAKAPVKKTAVKQSATKKSGAKSAAKKKTSQQAAKKGGKASAAKKKAAGKKAPSTAASVARTDTAGALAANSPMPAPIAARQVHLSFDRVLHACLFHGNQWLLPHTVESDASATLAGLRPTFITGALRIEAGTVPSRATAGSWNTLRTRVLKGNGSASFDLVLDLRRFKTPDEVTRHMRVAGGLLQAEAWTFAGLEEVARSRPEIWAAAQREAELQERKKGGYVQDPLLMAGLDYVLVPYGAGGKDLARRLAALEKGKMQPRNTGRPLPLLVVAGSTEVSAGEGFARGKTPAQRRLMVKDAAKMQNAKVAFAYPVFGPMATADRSYNALRDEFMYDTVRRSLQANNVLRSP